MFSRTLLQAASLLSILYNTASAATACNNDASLCSKAYNNITYLGAHDSPFLRDASTDFATSGNQYYDSVTQLEAGVRLLTAQVHQFNTSSGGTEWHLCHTTCDLLDMGTLESWLKNISSWMDSNPNDVVTVLVVNSDDATAAELGAQFNSSGIDKYAYTPSNGTSIPSTWPTLQTLISAGTRLMTFVASLSETDSSYPFLMDEFTFIFENNFENTSPTNYSCDPQRPTTLTSTTQAASSGRMFLMNHFLDSTELFGIETPNNTYANVTNAESGTGSLGSSIKSCTSVYDKPPNFVLVDFFNVGPAIASVDAANGVTNATGRKSVSTAALAEDDSSLGVSLRSNNVFAAVVAVVVAIAFGM